jgi:hypothetical protein
MGLDTFPRITIHTDFYYRQFLTKKFSTGYFTRGLIILLVVLLPFVTTYSAGGKYLMMVVNTRCF